MKLKNLQWVACALVASAALVGCSKDTSSDIGSNTGTNQSGDVRIKTNLVLDDVASSADFRGLQEELRLSIINKEKTAEGKYNGVRFQFEDEEKVKLYTYFKQNGQIFVADPVEITIKGTKEVGTGSAKTTYWAGLTELKVPAGIDLSASAGEVTVAGAIGVEGIDANGKATVKPMEVEADGDVEFQASVPMYFPEMKLNKADTTLVQTNADGSKTVPHLRFYGALLRMSFKSQLYDPVRLSQAIFQTEAFTTEGQMDLTSASETADPQWTSTQDGTTFQKINFGGEPMPRDFSKEVFLWVKPESYTNTREATVYIRENDYNYNPRERSEAITKRYKIKPLGKKVYRFPEIEVTSGLIFTEAYFDLEQPIWEIYNPTTESIKLADYTMNQLIRSGKEVSNTISTPLLSDRLHLAYDRDNATGLNVNGKANPTNLDDRITGWGSNRRVLPPQDLVLKPGDMILVMGPDGPMSTLTRRTFNGRTSNVAYVLTFRAGSIVSQTHQYRTAFVHNASSMYMLSKGGNADENDLSNVSDVLYYYKDKDSRLNIGNYVFVRRPDRNFGRRYWAEGEAGADSDWVFRELEMPDLGYRFSWYLDGDTQKQFNNSILGVRYWNHNKVISKSYKVAPLWKKDVAH